MNHGLWRGRLLATGTMGGSGLGVEGPGGGEGCLPTQALPLTLVTLVLFGVFTGFTAAQPGSHLPRRALAYHSNNGNKTNNRRY